MRFNSSVLVLIYFRKAGTYVPFRCFPRYCLWAIQRAVQAKTFRIVLLALWSPKLSFKAPSGILNALSYANSFGLDGWVRWDTDGSRRQVFDACRTGVYKTQKQGAAFNIRDEVALRSSLGDLSPRILAQDRSGSAYVEEWVNASAPRAYSYNDLELVRLVLVDKLYRIEKLDVVGFLNKATVPFSNEARAVIPELASRMGLDFLPVSRIHGDLVQSNISFTKENRPILYDWEYSRSCVVTHDVWFFLYHDLLEDGAAFELAYFLDEFERIVDWVFPKHIDLSALHLIHLYEREALLLWNDNIVDSSQALAKLRKSIRVARDTLSEKRGVPVNQNSDASSEK